MIFEILGLLFTVAGVLAQLVSLGIALRADVDQIQAVNMLVDTISNRTRYVHSLHHRLSSYLTPTQAFEIGKILQCANEHLNLIDKSGLRGSQTGQNLIPSAGKRHRKRDAVFWVFRGGKREISLSIVTELLRGTIVALDYAQECLEETQLVIEKHKNHLSRTKKRPLHSRDIIPSYLQEWSYAGVLVVEARESEGGGGSYSPRVTSQIGADIARDYISNLEASNQRVVERTLMRSATVGAEPKRIYEEAHGCYSDSAKASLAEAMAVIYLKKSDGL
jgi:hypothetical protein